MNPLLARYQAQVYAILRIVTGLLFACHGSQKLFGSPGGAGQAVPTLSLMGLAGVIELVGGLMIAAGLFVGWVAFVTSGEMAFAYFIAHASTSFWPIENHGELAVVYCFLFLYLSAHGDGVWSVGTLLRR